MRGRVYSKWRPSIEQILKSHVSHLKKSFYANQKQSKAIER